MLTFEISESTNDDSNKRCSILLPTDFGHKPFDNNYISSTNNVYVYVRDIKIYR